MISNFVTYVNWKWRYQAAVKTMRDRIAGKKHTKLQSGDSGFSTAGLKR